MFVFSVVHQAYEPRVIDEYVLRGNPTVIKCLIPSFVADYVHVVDWIVDETESLAMFATNHTLGNYGNRKCPHNLNCSYPLTSLPQISVRAFIFGIAIFTAVNQFYESQVYDMYVIRGNAAVFKCHIPSFVADHVQIDAWQDTEGGEYSQNEEYGTLIARVTFIFRQPFVPSSIRLDFFHSCSL